MLPTDQRFPTMQAIVPRQSVHQPKYSSSYISPLTGRWSPFSLAWKRWSSVIWLLPAFYPHLKAKWVSLTVVTQPACCPLSIFHYLRFHDFALAARSARNILPPPFCLLKDYWTSKAKLQSFPFHGVFSCLSLQLAPSLPQALCITSGALIPEFFLICLIFVFGLPSQLAGS